MFEFLTKSGFPGGFAMPKLVNYISEETITPHGVVPPFVTETGLNHAAGCAFGDFLDCIFSDSVSLRPVGKTWVPGPSERCTCGVDFFTVI